MVLFLDDGILATFIHCILCFIAAVLKHFGPRTPVILLKLTESAKELFFMQVISVHIRHIEIKTEVSEYFKFLNFHLNTLHGSIKYS